MSLILITLLLMLLIQGVVSLVRAARFSSFVSKSLLNPICSPTPRASIVAPIKGLEPGIEENIRRLYGQEYADYEIVFVIANSEDPARNAIERAISENRGRDARLVVAGSHGGRSQKVNNLLHGVAAAGHDSEVLVFVDSDARVTPEWLTALVAPLQDPAVGASTGYRWYVPATRGFWSAMVSAWNGAIAGTLGDHGGNFTWGGSTAIKRETFQRIEVARFWDSALSDDYALTRAVQQAGLQIAFVPRCVVLTREDFSMWSALEFTRRQVVITRVYKPAVWWAGLMSHSLFVSGFFGGVVWALYRLGTLGYGGATVAELPQRPQSIALGAVLLCLIYALGCATGWLRLRAARMILPQASVELSRMRIMFGLFWPLVSLLFVYDFVSSAAVRKIKWRGVWYEMRSPTETIVLGHD